MPNRRLDNTIFLMYLVTDSYCKAHDITAKEFLELSNEYNILYYVSECPDVFDWMTEAEMVEEVDKYIKESWTMYD